MTADEFKKRYSCNVLRDVEWADLDAFQHVNNKVYFRYFEKIRIDYFEQNGLMDLMEKEKVGPILASTQCRFKLPLSYPDQVLIGTYITDLLEDSLLMKYAVYSLGHERIAAEGDGSIVCYDYAAGKRAPFPAQLFSRLQKKAAND